MRSEDLRLGCSRPQASDKLDWLCEPKWCECIRGLDPNSWEGNRGAKVLGGIVGRLGGYGMIPLLQHLDITHLQKASYLG